MGVYDVCILEAGQVFGKVLANDAERVVWGFQSGEAGAINN